MLTEQTTGFGGEAVSLALNYSNAAAFAAAGYADISTNQSYVGGVVRQQGHFSFSRVFQSGHEGEFYPSPGPLSDPSPGSGRFVQGLKQYVAKPNSPLLPAGDRLRDIRADYLGPRRRDGDRERSRRQ